MKGEPDIDVGVSQSHEDEGVAMFEESLRGTRSTRMSLHLDMAGD